MRKLRYILSLMFVYSLSHAGLITHGDYTSGTAITAAGQNTNENLIFNEFNGNIESANIKDGTIVNADVSGSAAIAYTKLDTTTQSTITFVNQMGSYKRPELVWQSVTTVDVATNTSTNNQTCIMFPNERRCVTEVPPSKYRRFASGSTAEFTSGTESGGMLSGQTLPNNGWIGLYAVKSKISASNFVIVGIVVDHTATNFTTFDTSYFGTNSWVYLGSIHRGDGGTSGTDILNFVQGGNHTDFINASTGGSFGGAAHFPGLVLSSAASSTSLEYTYAAGMGIAQIPSHLSSCNWSVGRSNPGTAKTMTVYTTGATYLYYEVDGFADRFSFQVRGACSKGIRLDSATTGVGIDLVISGFDDAALGIGYNPQ